MNKELTTYREGVTTEYASLYELYCRFTATYEGRISEEEQAEEEELIDRAHACFTEVAGTMYAELRNLETQLMDFRCLLDGYIRALTSIERDYLDKIAETVEEEYEGARDELDSLERGMESFERRKTHWERVRYRMHCRWGHEEHLVPSDRRAIKSESDQLLAIELHFANGSLQTLKIAEGTPRIEEPEDVVYF